MPGKVVIASLEIRVCEKNKYMESKLAKTETTKGCHTMLPSR